MSHHLSFSHNHLAQAHDLSDEQLAAHPDQTGRILYFALPFAFALILNLALFARNLRVHHNNFVRTLPSTFSSLAALLISLIGAGTIGIYAIIADAWTVKEWILFGVVCVLVGLKALIYTADTSPTLFITAIVTIFAALPNEWLFSELRDMSEATEGEAIWKHTSRNVVGFIEAVLIIFAVEYLSESLVHIFQTSSKAASYFFWIVAPLAVVGVLVLNILSYGPFLDQIGYIVAAILLFLGAAANTLFYREHDSEGAPLKK